MMVNFLIEKAFTLKKLDLSYSRIMHFLPRNFYSSMNICYIFCQINHQYHTRESVKEKKTHTQWCYFLWNLFSVSKAIPLNIGDLFFLFLPSCFKLHWTNILSYVFVNDSHKENINKIYLQQFSLVLFSFLIV